MQAIFHHFGILWALQKSRFCHFSESSDFEYWCFFDSLFAQNNSCRVLESFLFVFGTLKFGAKIGLFSPSRLTIAFAK